MNYKKIAVLMTCYNRRNTTINCLNALFKQYLPDSTTIDVFLVDDGSIDGTAKEVQNRFPDVNILTGSGSLFWGGGMRLAWFEAAKHEFDAFLWLNDDTILLPNAISDLISASIDIYNIESKDAIIVGSCFDSLSLEQTYGGRNDKDNKSFVRPNGFYQTCDLMNGNIVFVPLSVYNLIGNISQQFVHLGGDNDYGKRAIKAGFKVYVAPNFLGTCQAHEAKDKWSNPEVSLIERFKSLNSPKGQPPYEVYIYARRHKGILWPLDLIKLYFRVFFPGCYNKIKNIK